MKAEILQKLELSTLMEILGDLSAHAKFLPDYQSTITKEQLITEIIHMDDVIGRFGTPLEDWQKESHEKRIKWENVDNEGEPS